jgi:hypothetical protein
VDGEGGGVYGAEDGVGDREDALGMEVVAHYRLDELLRGRGADRMCLHGRKMIPFGPQEQRNARGFAKFPEL